MEWKQPAIGVITWTIATWTAWTLAAPPVAAAASEPIRGAFFYYYMAIDHLDELASHGFNTGLDKHFEESLGAARLAQMTIRRARADSLGIDLYICLNFMNERLVTTEASPGRRYRDHRGVVHSAIPCPADTSYWAALLDELVAPVARATRGPARLALDLELYGTALTHYAPGPCTCVDCKLDYAGYSGRNRELAISWIDRRPLRDFEDLERAERGWLCEFLTDRLAALAAEVGDIELAILDLGRLGLPNRALVDALENLGWPTVDFTESTYATGSAVPHAELAAAYRERELEVEVAAGLWLRRWTPELIEEEAVRLAEREHGYWIFTSLSLHAPPEELHQDYLKLLGPQAEYWQALARANYRLSFNR
jgi:hypothetical protein